MGEGGVHSGAGGGDLGIGLGSTHGGSRRSYLVAGGQYIRWCVAETPGNKAR